MPNSLSFVPVTSRLDLVSPTVANHLASWPGPVPIDEILVAEIDPDFAGGIEFCSRYGISHSQGVNCIIVLGKRGASRSQAAILVPVGFRADLNGVVRKQLGVREVSLGATDTVLEATRMEYGSITPFGLPEDWPILIDDAIVKEPRVVMGSGLRRSKLSVPGIALLSLPSALPVIGLSRESP
jgi:prolyl-tRNA editing enzyme YbaK/EbsC (Cys-tRNA(Pro) deacylase)